MINYDPGISVKKAKSSSVLEIEEADKSNNGNYTCSPSNAVPGSIIVHVLNSTAGEKHFVNTIFFSKYYLLSKLKF